MTTPWSVSGSRAQRPVGEADKSGNIGREANGPFATSAASWPLFDLEIATPLVRLRLPNEAEVAELAAVAAAGVHAADEQPFLHPWTEGSGEDRARNVLQSHWRKLGRWTNDDWSLGMAVFVDDEPVGAVSLNASGFAVAREVSTTSWLGIEHHGRGYGTHARAGLLTLAFDYLDAESARTDVFTDNLASLGVSRNLGYEPDGISRDRRGDEVLISERLRLSRDRWNEGAADRPVVTVAGFDACRPLFGV